MLRITLTEEQHKSLMGLLDLALKTGGLEILQVIVGLHNVLASAESVEEEKTEDEENKE